MGLQTDGDGRIFTMQNLRDGTQKTALVPHHGTLLRVSPGMAKKRILWPQGSEPQTGSV